MRHLAKALVSGGFLAGGVGLALMSAVVQGMGQVPSADEIVTRMMQRDVVRHAALQGWVSERSYRVEYHGTGGTHEAEMRVHAEFIAPDKKQFTVVSESGSKLICERVLRKLVEAEQEASQGANRMQMALTPENYRLKLLGEEVVTAGEAPTKTWVLEVAPKVASRFTYRGRVWVSEEDFATVRVQGEPAKSPSWWINRASFDSRYERAGMFWLPMRNVSESHVRIGGQAKLTIEYGEYRVVALPERAASGREQGGTAVAGRVLGKTPE